MMLSTRPHVARYTALKSASPPSLYCMSPRPKTACACTVSSSDDVARCWQAPATPAPPLNSGSVGSQEMSPAAATVTGGGGGGGGGAGAAGGAASTPDAS